MPSWSADRCGDRSRHQRPVRSSTSVARDGRGISARRAPRSSGFGPVRVGEVGHGQHDAQDAVLVEGVPQPHFSQAVPSSRDQRPLPLQLCPDHPPRRSRSTRAVRGIPRRAEPAVAGGGQDGSGHGSSRALGGTGPRAMTGQLGHRCRRAARRPSAGLGADLLRRCRRRGTCQRTGGLRSATSSLGGSQRQACDELLLQQEEDDQGGQCYDDRTGGDEVVVGEERPRRLLIELVTGYLSPDCSSTVAQKNSL